MDRRIEATAHVPVSPQHVVLLLADDAAVVLGGVPSTDNDSFVAQIALDVAGGTSLAHDVDMVFGRLSDDGDIIRFGLSWRARGHEHLFPVFGGDLEIHPDSAGSILRLRGRYTLPLGALGAFGDGLVGHRLARRAIQDFLDKAAVRLLGADRDIFAAAAGPASRPRGDAEVHPEIHIG